MVNNSFKIEPCVWEYIISGHAWYRKRNLCESAQDVTEDVRDVQEPSIKE